MEKIEREKREKEEEKRKEKREEEKKGNEEFRHMALDSGGQTKAVRCYTSIETYQVETKMILVPGNLQ